MQTIERHVEFESSGVTCRGLFVRPDGDGRAPLVVLSHGLGGVYEMRLDAFARRFAEAGYAALTFDYRGFGRSDGTHRHVLIREEQQADIEAALAHGRTLDGVDGERVVLWGTSLAGGHMIDVTSKRDDIAATIIQAPFTDGLASARALSTLSALGTGLFVAGHIASRLLRGKPLLVPLAAPQGLPALMTKPDVIEGVMRLMPEGTVFSKQLSKLYRRFAQGKIALDSHVSTSELEEPFEDGSFVGSVILPSGTAMLNGVSANFGLDILSWRPGKKLATLRSPILVCVCEGDSVAPPGPTIAYAKQAPRGELRVYPYNHFDIYVGEPHDLVFRDQLSFLQRVVPVVASSATQPGEARG